ncbi:hypothetical protein PBCV1_a487R [Paramecium bursaria Chlorella virus 1]|uniref:Uncharacterized protein n=1 Tax=Paramecium bursaria Chlorella virus 1 TaxID=10506 RepID=Q98537_PBCV1|nr:hypothetical protein PBCV1_a487R [Paramecium bursaria Chlorella virus 1]AAC96854.1 hypothetical protein [Paramecium bursaria Chlorella virus 1]
MFQHHNLDHHSPHSNRTHYSIEKRHQSEFHKKTSVTSSYRVLFLRYRMACCPRPQLQGMSRCKPF